MRRKKVSRSGLDLLKIKKNKYYLVIIRRTPWDKILPTYIQEIVFDKYDDYIKFKERFPQMFKDFFLVPTKGKVIIEHRLKRKKLLYHIGITLRDKTKYVYPTERVTKQDRKSMRTKLRRQQRVWGYSLDNNFI